MRAITICQPYAALIAVGWKRVENRDYNTSVRGQIAIHAGKSRAWLKTYNGPMPDRKLQFGAVVATARLVDCVQYELACTLTSYEWLAAHAYAHGPWCWILEDIQPLAQPLRARGSQGFWKVDLGDLEPERQTQLFA